MNAMHEEGPLQFRSLINSSSLPVTEEDSWLLSSFLGFGDGFSSDDRTFSQKILESLKKVTRFTDFQRISIVRRLGFSNQLQAVCVYEDGNQTANMNVGYSCFVDPNGSLFSLKKDNIRIYKSSKKIVQKYEENDKKPQRSIYRISQSSYHGEGYCIGLFVNKHLEGLFFANRIGEGVLGQSKFDYTLFSCLAAISTNYLFKLGSLSFVYRSMAQQNQSDYLGKKLDLSFLKNLIEDYLKEFQYETSISSMKIDENHGLNPTLVSHGNVALTFSRCFYASKFQPTGILNVKKNNDLLVFSVQGHYSHPSLFDSILLDEVRRDAKILGQTVHVTEDQLSISCPYDGLSTEHYSIESRS
jgi:hypothetical protein